MFFFSIFTVILWFGIFSSTFSQKDDNVSVPSLLKVDYPKVVLYNYKMSLTATLSWSSVTSQTSIRYQVREGDSLEGATEISSGTLVPDSKNKIKIKSEIDQGTFVNGFLLKDINVSSSVSRKIWFVLLHDDNTIIANSHKIVHGMPAPVTLIPIIIMLAVAFLSSQATLALLIGIFIAATFINGFNPMTGFLRTMDHYTINALADSDHAKVIMFTFYLSAAVALIQKSGGAEAMAISVTKYATTRWRGQWATYFIGVLIFIDDLSSCMVVGANMRVVTDRLNLSREKLSFIVHVTSAPLTSLSPVSSWIGFILGVISTQLRLLSVDKDPFMFFISTLPSRFFPIFILLFCGFLMLLRRDFGPMLVAERRAHFRHIVVEDSDTLDVSEDFLSPEPKTPRRLINSLLPISSIIVLTVVGLLVSGYYSLLAKVGTDEEKKFNIATLAGDGDSYGSLLYASFFSCMLCVIMYRVQKILSFSEGINIIMYGFKDMVETMLILVFAWGVGQCFEDMGVAEFIVSALSGTIPSGLIPTLSCLLASIMSFTTGTSWGTMAIMLPLAMPLGYAGEEKSIDLLILTASGVFSGAMFGDLCSPISATTILTCTSVQIPVKTHVSTQFPYAISALVVSIGVGYLPVGFNLYPDWAGLLIGTGLLILSIFLIGVPTESHTPSRWTFIRRKFFNQSESSETPTDVHSDYDLEYVSKSFDHKP